MATDVFERRTVSQLKPSTPIELVQWVHTPDGLESRLVDGLYLGSDDAEWRLVKGGELLRYSRDDWELCLR